MSYRGILSLGIVTVVAVFLCFFVWGPEKKDRIVYQGHYDLKNGERCFDLMLVVQSKDFSFDVYETDSSGVMEPLGAKLMVHDDSEWKDVIFHNDRWGRRLNLEPGSYPLKIWAPYPQTGKSSKVVIQEIESDEFVW